jgi:hypothetical protein
MPEELLARVWAHVETGGPLVEDGWPIADRQAEQQRLEVPRGFGLRAFTSMVYPSVSRPPTSLPDRVIRGGGPGAGFCRRAAASDAVSRGRITDK